MKFFTKKLNNNFKKEDSLINPKILEVNLIKDEVGIEFEWGRHLLPLFLSLIFSALLVAEIYYGLDWWQKQEEQKTIALNDEYKIVSRQISNINAKSNDVIVFKDKLQITKKLADSHVYWTDFFDWLEKSTLNSISYGGFSGDLTGKYSLGATAKTFSDISWQVKAFKDNKFIDSVRVDSGSSGRADEKAVVNSNNPVSFSLDLKVKKDIFYRQSDIPAQAPVQTSVQTPSQEPIQTSVQTSVQAPAQTPIQTPVQEIPETPIQVPATEPNQDQIQIQTQ